MKMEKEYFLTGYCRTTDQSRTVAIEIEDGKLIEVDCCYENCVHAPNCTIANEIAALLADK
jgi:hypothetical protein